MSVKSYKVVLLERSQIKDFIEKYHYSKSINGCIADYCFGLFDKDIMIGAAFFGRMAMAGQWKKYGDNAVDVIELRRLCCIDDTPKNTESYFIGKMLKYLKKNTEIKTVVSYADAEYQHSGIIYQASNFEYLGKTPGAKVIIYKSKRYHDKTIRTKYKGELKPFAKRIKEALDNGTAKYKKTAGKHIYIYKLVEVMRNGNKTI